MRIGTPSSNEFVQKLGSKNREIEQAYQAIMKGHTGQVAAKVMLADSTITEQSTFDPSAVAEFYRDLTQRLHGWAVRDVTTTNNEDLRRIFTKFEIKIGNYLLSGHLSIQFHVLLYYRPDHRVPQCQKELAGVVERSGDSESDAAKSGEELVLRRMREMGYSEMDHQKLFEIFYENDELREKILGEIDGQAGSDYTELSRKKAALLAELDGFLMEAYKTTNVLIDDTRLVTGEEGILCTFDLEFLKNKTKEGLFDPRKMPAGIQAEIHRALCQFADALHG